MGGASSLATLVASIMLVAAVGPTAVAADADDAMAADAGTAPATEQERAIHWRTEHVDLRADALDLRLGDRTLNAGGSWTGRSEGFGTAPDWDSDSQRMGRRSSSSAVAATMV